MERQRHIPKRTNPTPFLDYNDHSTVVTHLLDADSQAVNIPHAVVPAEESFRECSTC